MLRKAEGKVVLLGGREYWCECKCMALRDEFTVEIVSKQPTFCWDNRHYN